MEWCVYILECRNGAYYTGMTNNLVERVKEHKVGKGGKFTRAFKVKRLVYKEACKDRSSALKREAAIKRLPRALKEGLVTGGLT